MSSSSSSGLSDPIRIGNFFSSFDYQSVIDKLTYARQGPIRQLDDKESKLASQKTAVNQIITRFSALLSRVNTLASATSASGKTATVSGTGVSASATPSAVPGSFTVSVTQLATGTTARGSALTAAVDAASKLDSANFGTTVSAGTFTLKAATGVSKTYTVDPAAQSLQGLGRLIVTHVHRGMVVGADQVREIAQALRHHVEHRRRGRQRHVLHEPRDARPRLPPHRAAVRREVAGQDLKQRGLPRAVPPDDGHALARLHLQRAIVEEGQVAVGVEDVVERDEGHWVKVLRLGAWGLGREVLGS